ncbi:hypothetical protein [Pseudomonas sp. NFACC02]|nr:hypothetical protein [Pseudomonas sp. NFACC02]
MSRDLPGTGSKFSECGVPDTPNADGFAAAAQQIAGRATLLQMIVSRL